MRNNFILLLILLFASCNNSSNVDYFKNSNNSEVKIPIIEKHIGNQKVLFIVDSGANISVIDSTWYSDHSNLFNRNSDINIILTGVSGSSQVKSSIVYTSIDSNCTVFTTSNLSSVTNKLKSLGFPIIGILGSDYLKDNHLVIDYYKRAVYPANKKMYD
jgi:hypothetical protein